MSERDTKIGPTAHYTAYVWHRLHMPHAEYFATPTGRRLFWAFRLAGEWLATLSPTHPTIEQYLEMRHRALEKVLQDGKPDCVVELGAGLSRRGVTWAADHGVRYVEVDLPHMIAAKRAIIEQCAPSAVRRRAGPLLSHVSMDVLSDALVDELVRVFAGAQRPFVLAEGLLGYFPMEERRDIVRRVCEALSRSGGGTFACDLRSAEGGASVATAAKALRGAVWIATRGRGLRTDFESHAHVRVFFRDAGYCSSDTVDTSEFAPRLAQVRNPARVWICTVASTR
jgi:O-methyltransferase involved in polyketide biosynthesis